MPTPPRQPDDPDAAGLPPGVELPDPVRYRADQLRGLLLSNVVALAVLLVLVALMPNFRALPAGCATVVAVVAVFNLLRWLDARRALRSHEAAMRSDTQDPPDFPDQP
ncbi:MAG: hypothetical protein K8S99_10425 [Planctomycetes bacterium]|nr:hypothetical protein [Planctomycetota bacterium]